MKIRYASPIKAGLCAAVLLLATASRAEGPPVNNVVNLTGWLHVEDITMADVTVEVAVNGVSFMAPVSENGRFNVLLPADAQATLHFEKPGHLPKEVIVDTRNAQDGTFDEKTRRVSIAVILELERHMGGLTYAGPVGTLGFEPGGGCIAVQHDRTRVFAKPRKGVMVF